MSVLRAEGLAVSLADGTEVLRDLAFSVARGQVLGLVGESGAGKSMIGRMIAGHLPAGFRVSAGSLAFGGEDLVRIAPARRRALLGDRIAFIPQEPLTALSPLMTIAAQFGEHSGRLGVPAVEHRGRTEAALASVGLPRPGDLLDRYPFQLSGGMCQRVLLAMAFASDPALLVADEPTTALDVSTQVHIVGLLRALQADHGTAILFITHDLRLASRVCDDLLVLYAGEMVERGPAREVMGRPRHPYTRSLKAANPSLAGPVRRLAALPNGMPGIAAYRDLPGCRFGPRCPIGDPTCVGARPGPTPVGPGHVVRCSPGCLRGAAQLETPLLPPAPDVANRETILSLVGVSKRYPGRRDWLGRRGPGVDAVRAVDLAVRAGEFVGIVGESGSGKSTLARLVMGLEPPTAGRVVVDGVDVTANARATRSVRLGALQMVFQDPQSALNPRRPISRLVTQVMEARASRAPAPERLARARALLAETGLPPELLDRYPAQLSGGQRQRVNIARALCVTPRLLVADEIVSGLDVSVQAQILNLLLDLRAERGFALLLISHDLAVVRYLCSRVLVMSAGQAVEEGPVETVFADPKHPSTRTLLAAVPPDDPDRPWPEPGSRPSLPAHAA